MAGYNDNKNEHAFKTFASDMKSKDAAPVIYMYGIEEYLIEWAVGVLAHRYTGADNYGAGFEKPDPDTVTAEEIIQSCETFSMFSDKRLIWLKDYPPLYQDNSKGFGDKQLALIEQYLDMPNPQTVLVFSSSAVRNDPKDRREKKTALNKLLLKKAKCYDFCPLDRRALRAFTEKRLRESGLSVKKEDVEYLIDSTGYFHRETDYRLMNLVSDIDKIAGLSSGNEDRLFVRREDIERAILGDTDTYIFDFLDHLAFNRKEEAFTLLNNMLSDGSDVFGLLGSMVNQFELMTEVLELKNEGMTAPAIAKEIGVHEFRIKKAMSSAGRLSVEKLKDILCQLYKIDMDIKSGDIDGAVALELLIGRI